MPYLLAVFLLLLSGCTGPNQADISKQYTQAANYQCGGGWYKGTTPATVMQRHKCIANLQRSIVIPHMAHQDLYERAVAFNGIAARDYASGVIDRQVFESRLAMVESQRVNDMNARIRAAQPDVMHVQQPLRQTHPQSIPSLRPRSFTCNSTGLGYSTRTHCEENRGVDTSVFHRLKY